MNRMNILGAAIVLALLSGTAAACDSSKPRCQLLNEMVDVLKYEQAIAAVQTRCETRAQSWRPDRVPARDRRILFGINKESAQWEGAMEAHETYVAEACGGEEIKGLILEGYRIAWDGRAPGEKLAGALAKVKASGRDGAKADAEQVSADVNRAIGPLLAGMSRAAMKNYENRLAALATGKALELIGATCSPTKDASPQVPTSTSAVFAWPPRRN